VAKRASSRLELKTSEDGKLLKSCLAALEPHTERFLQKTPMGYSADIRALVAALGGSSAMSYPKDHHMDGYPL
jgi:hypothetical protein